MTRSEVRELEVTPVDGDGRLLRLDCGPTHHRAVASRLIHRPGAVVGADILAASHRVRLRHPGVPDWEVSETVACASPTGPTSLVDPEVLPSRHRWSAGGWDVELRSATRFGSDAVATARARIERALACDGEVLVGRFPGHPDAVTAIAVAVATVAPADAPGAVAWRTWHLYPGDDPHVVVSSTIARRRGDRSEEKQHR